MGLIFILVTVILVFIFIYNNVFDGNKFIKELSPLFKNIIEDDYEFLVRLRYEDEDVDLEEMFEKRIRNAVLAFLIVLFLSILAGKLAFIVIFLAVVLALLIFKMPYFKLKRMYKAHLHSIDLLLPYYLKGLEILVQHYTVPVALSKSIETAPNVFKNGLLKLVAKIDAGDSTIQPYIDFANEYPVRDSMRMMRLLYRLSLGRQERKQEQLLTFSRSISNLQQKARDIKYKNRLEKMENKTMSMLITTGVGLMVLLVLAVIQLMGI